MANRKSAERARWPSTGCFAISPYFPKGKVTANGFVSKTGFRRRHSFVAIVLQIAHPPHATKRPPCKSFLRPASGRQLSPTGWRPLGRHLVFFAISPYFPGGKLAAKLPATWPPTYRGGGDDVQQLHRGYRKYFRASRMMVPSVRGANRRSGPKGTGAAAGAMLAFRV